MGTNVITLCTGTRDREDMWRRHPDNDGTEAWNDLLDAMERALVIAEAEDVYLAIEPEQANVIHSAQGARKLLDHFRSRHLRIIVDPANLFERAAPSEVERIVEEAFDLLGDEIVIAHAKDRDARGRFVAAGQGVLNYDHYVAQLRRINFAGALVLHGLSEDEVRPCVSYLRTEDEERLNMPVFTHQGIRFHYVDTGGDGVPLVLQHGLGGDCSQPTGLFAPAALAAHALPRLPGAWRHSTAGPGRFAELRRVRGRRDSVARWPGYRGATLRGHLDGRRRRAQSRTPLSCPRPRPGPDSSGLALRADAGPAVVRGRSLP